MPNVTCYKATLKPLAGILCALLLVVSCQPPMPTPVLVFAVRIESSSTTLLAGSSLELNGFIEGNDLAANSGLNWRVSRGAGSLSLTYGNTVLLLAPQQVTAAFETDVTVTSIADPTKFFVLMIVVQPVVSDIQLFATRVSLLPNETSVISARVLNDARADLNWSIEGDVGSLQPIGLNRFVFTSPAVRENTVVRIRVVSVLDPTREAFMTLLLLAWNSPVALGALHSMAVRTDGTVWTWGSNLYGAVHPSLASQDVLAAVPVQSSELNAAKFTEFIGVAAGSYHGFAWSANGSLWAWGLNNEGQLGIGNTLETRAPKQVKLENVVQISAGESHTLALLKNGTVWAWGRNLEGQLGTNLNSTSSLPIQILGLENMVQVSAGQFFSVALRSDGTVWVWGDNRQGQLTSAPETTLLARVPQQVQGLTSINQVSAGGNHVLAVNQAGRVFAWGANNQGQLGDSSLQAQVKPVLLGLEQIQMVSAGFEHSLARTRTGQIFVWGSNSFGQLGDQNILIHTSPINMGIFAPRIQAGYSQSAVITDSTSLQLWGRNHVGQIKIPVSKAETTPFGVIDGILLF